jgi:cyclophilin family peptidyl-prolyl cis-trans isomerase
MNTKNTVATLLTLTLISLNTMAQEQAELPPYPQIEVKTNAGDLQMELFTAKAPIHVRTFVELVNEGFYDNTIFHRVVGGFVIQGGGYNTDYKLKPAKKFIPNESGNGLSNRRGFIGMARTGDPHSADTQFYVNLADNVALDPRPTRWGYTVFGKITEGMEVIDEIGYRATGPGPIEELAKDVPVEPIIIISMRMVEELPEQEPADQTSQPEAPAGD